MRTLRKIGESGVIPNTATSQFLLDTEGLTGAVGAYSLRKLRNAYSGSCIRIRRVNDNAEASIGFSNNWIDKAAVDAHCTTNDGFVVSLFDQSGNSNSLSQPSAALQFKIWNGSTRDWVATIDSRPIMAPLVSNGVYFLNGVLPLDTAALSICCISGFFGAAAPANVIRSVYSDGGSLSGIYIPNLAYDPEIYDAQTLSISDFVTGVAPALNTSYVTGWAATSGTPTTSRVRFNGSTFISTTIPYQQATIGRVFIGGGAAFRSANHSFQEAIWWLRDIGDVGLSLYAGNCLSSSQYGNVSYV